MLSSNCTQDEQADYFFDLGKYYYELAFVQIDVDDQAGAVKNCKLAYDFLNKSLNSSNNLNKNQIEEYLSELNNLIEKNNKQTDSSLSVSSLFQASSTITSFNSIQDDNKEKLLSNPFAANDLKEDINLNVATSSNQLIAQLASSSLETKEKSCHHQLSIQKLNQSFDDLSISTSDGEDQEEFLEDETLDPKFSITTSFKTSAGMDPFLRPLNSSWDEDQKLFTELGNRKCFPISFDPNIALIDLDPRDINFQFVLDLFSRSKHQSEQQGLIGFSRVKIKRICLINNPHYQEQFEKEIYLLSQRKKNPVFEPKWENMIMSTTRKRVAKIFKEQVAKYSDERLDFLPIWHGSRLNLLESILKTGFANLATTDLGYYGKGIYGTTNAEYAKRVYSEGYNSDGILLLNWIGVNSALMVAGMGDLELLKGRGNYANYDAHFIPVVPRNHYMHKLGKEDVYFPLQLKSDRPVYDEVVVFGRQILARYVVYTECEPLSPTSSLKLELDLSQSLVEDVLDKNLLLKNISHNPWIAINYSMLSQLLRGNETVKLPKKVENKIIARLPKHLLQISNNGEYDAISLCQIALFLDENCLSAYYNLANTLRKKLTPDRKILLALPIDKYYSAQELYQVALQRYFSKSSVMQPCVDQISRSRCLAKLAQNTSDRAIAKEKAQEAIKFARTDPLAWVALGTTLLPNESILISNSDDSEFIQSFNAKEIFKEALKLAPKSAEALLGLAQLLQTDEERVEINGKKLNFQEILIMALEAEPDDLNIIEEIFNLYNKQQSLSPIIKELLFNLLKKIWPYYNDCSKVWELLSYCLESHKSVTLGNNPYAQKQLIEEAFRLDPTNIKLYGMLMHQGCTINFDFLVQKMKGNCNLACKEIKQDIDLYVPVLVSSIDPSYSQFSEEQLLGLEECVSQYITSANSQILWIQGDTGSGKTLFARHLEKFLWEQNLDLNQVPLLINWEQSFLKNSLQPQGLEAKEIEIFEQNVKSKGIKLILIIDNYCGEGYDLSPDFNQLFIILSQKRPLERPPVPMINYYIVPFIDEQIRKYLYNYVQNPSYNRCNWSIDKYEYALDYFQVRDLCKEPFLLKLILQVIPEFLSFDKNVVKKVTNKIGLQKLTRFKPTLVMSAI